MSITRINEFRAKDESADALRAFLTQQWPELLKGRIAWIEHAEPRLCSIVGMRHDRVQRGKIVGADINFAGAEQHLECLLTHADVQAEYARSIKIRDTITLVVCSGNGRERQHAIRPVEKERVAQRGHGFDARKRVHDVVGNTFFVHRLPCLAYRVVNDSTRPIHLRIMRSIWGETDAHLPRARSISTYGCSAHPSIAPNAVESDPGYAQIFEIYSPGALGREGTNEAASAMRWLSRICCRFVHDAPSTEWHPRQFLKSHLL